MENEQTKSLGEWTTDSPVEAGWYWIVRKDMKAMPVEVYWFVEREPFTTRLSSVQMGGELPAILVWRDSMHDKQPNRLLAQVQYWGPRIQEEIVPEEIAVIIQLQGVRESEDMEKARKSIEAASAGMTALRKNLGMGPPHVHGKIK